MRERRLAWRVYTELVAGVARHLMSKLLSWLPCALAIPIVLSLFLFRCPSGGCEHGEQTDVLRSLCLFFLDPKGMEKTVCWFVCSCFVCLLIYLLKIVWIVCTHRPPFLSRRYLSRDPVPTSCAFHLDGLFGTFFLFISIDIDSCRYHFGATRECWKI